MSTLSSQPQSIGKNLDQGIKLYVRGLGKVLPLSFIMAIMGVVPDLMQANPESLAGSDPAGLATFFIGYFLVFIVVALSIYGGILHYYAELATGGTPSIASSLKRGFSKIIPLLLATIVYMIAVVLGTIALVIPGIILMLSLYFYGAAIVIDNKGFFESIKFSHGLVWGNWWRTLMVLTVPILIIMALYSILMIALGVNMAMLAGVGAGASGIDQAGMMQTLLWFSVGTAVVNSLVTPLFYAVMVVLFHDLKLRKGGGDLEARLAGA